MRKVVIPIAFCLAVTAGVVDWGRRPAARAAPRYRCRELGTLGGRVAEAEGLNNLGHVVGSSQVTGDYVVHAFLHDAERMIDLGGKPGWANSKAHGIDDEGRVVGGAMVRSNSGECQRGFLLDTKGGQIRYLGWEAQPGVPGDRSALLPVASTAYALGSAGEVVGMTRFPNQGQYPRACVWDDAGPLDLGTFGGLSSAARAINRAGWVVGKAQTVQGDEHAFLFAGGRMQDLGTLGGAASNALDVNDLGEVVGEADLPDGVPHGFLYSQGRMRDLRSSFRGSSSVAVRINNRGQIVGTAELPAARGMEERAVLWQAGAIYDLNALCDAPGVLLLRARAINERGQIVANGLTREGEMRAFLLTPVDAERP